jgi:mannan endo-1,4-beta-mannosidase
MLPKSDRLRTRFSRLLLASLAIAGGLVVQSSVVANGVNLQPAYYNNGYPNFAWSLMKTKGNIRSLRIEVDTSRVDVWAAKYYIDQAKQNGYNDIIVTFHQYGGSDNSGDLQTAANWWKNNYGTLGGGFKINLCNEWGSHNLSASAYASAYNAAISTIRSVYSGTIVMDIPGWGQETLTAYNAFKTSSPRVNDGNVIVSTHIYPGNWNQGRNHVYNTSDMANDLGNIGKTILVGEFGTGSGSCDWSGCVNYAKSRGWTVNAWCWNGDGGSLNMVSPSWAQQAWSNTYSTNSYFNTVYPKL